MNITRTKEDKWKLLDKHQNPLFPDLVIPAGFEWDGASIPSYLHSFLDPRDYGILLASCSHDYLYGRSGEVFYDLKLTRKQIDMIFYDEMKFHGVGSFEASIIYSAVRLFGGAHFN